MKYSPPSCILNEIHVISDSPPRLLLGVRDEGVKAYSWATNDAIYIQGGPKVL